MFPLSDLEDYLPSPELKEGLAQHTLRLERPRGGYQSGKFQAQATRTKEVC